MSQAQSFTLELSLLIQALTLLFNAVAFLIPLDAWDLALKQILGLETGVQVIELIFYLWYRQRLLTKGNDITKFRYYDWAITTPTMLVSTASYYGYLVAKAQPKKSPFSIWSFIQKSSGWMSFMIVMNAVMLGVGYLQELGLLSIVWSSLLGYLALVASFGTMYTQIVSKAPQQRGLFSFMAGVWSLYGVAAMLPAQEKNTSYNVLDIFAKNFYGVFLGYLIVKNRV